jgi:hypothetical protein
MPKRSGMDEKETKKYKQGLEIAIMLEKDRYGSYKDYELKDLTPSELYDFLQDEWWMEWNGLLQEWDNYKEPPL